MRPTLRKLHTDIRRQAIGVNAVLVTWLAHASTPERWPRLAARCADLERERLTILEQWLASHERGCRAVHAGDVDAAEEAIAHADAALARLRRRKSFLRITLDEHEDGAPSIILDQLVAGKALATAFPVPSGQSIRLRHTRRCDFGFQPRYFEVALQLSGDQRNYHDYQIQLRLVGPSHERAIGEPMLASRFHSKDGSRVLLPFPRHDGNPVVVGTLEHLEVLIRNCGTTSDLDSAFIGVGLSMGRLQAQQLA